METQVLSVLILLVTKLLCRLLPLGPDRQVVHRERGVSRHVLLDLEEGGQRLGNLLVLEGGAGLQQEEALAPDMARGVVDVELIVLVLIEEGAPRLEDGKVIVIPEWR